MIKQRLKYYSQEILQKCSLITSHLINILPQKQQTNNPIIKLYTQTYDGANEAVHNKVLYFLKNCLDGDIGDVILLSQKQIAN